MKFKVRNVMLSTGWPYVAILTVKDAQHLGLHPTDRIKITQGKKEWSAILDVSSTHHAVNEGEIGLFHELAEAIGNERDVNVTPGEKPISLDFIRKKLEGFRLNKKELFQIIKDITDRRLSDVEMTYFVNSYHLNGHTEEELVWLTDAIVNTGKRLNFGKKIVLDKHCIGGIPGNRTTMIVVPIIASLGILIPKTSSRSITSPAGTADTMEVLANVTLETNKVKKIVQKIGGCIVWGGAVNLAPADDQIIRVRHPMSIEMEGQMLASVVAKKISVGSTHLLIDIPYGHGAKCKTHEAGVALGRKFIWLTKKFNIKTKITLTQGSEPIGNGIGPALEAIDVLKVLSNAKDAPLDLKAKGCYLAGVMLELAGKAKKGKGFDMALQAVNNGSALKKMNEIIDAQGRYVKNIEDIKLGNLTKIVKASKSGKIKGIDNLLIAEIAKVAGAPLDKGAGVYLFHHVGDKVKKGDKLFTIYAESPHKMEHIKHLLKENVIKI